MYGFINYIIIKALGFASQASSTMTASCGDTMHLLARPDGCKSGQVDLGVGASGNPGRSGREREGYEEGRDRQGEIRGGTIRGGEGARSGNRTVRRTDSATNCRECRDFQGNQEGRRWGVL